MTTREMREAVERLVARAEFVAAVRQVAAFAGCDVTAAHRACSDVVADVLASGDEGRIAEMFAALGVAPHGGALH